jgi:hypothetical protein
VKVLINHILTEKEPDHRDKEEAPEREISRKLEHNKKKKEICPSKTRFSKPFHYFSFLDKSSCQSHPSLTACSVPALLSFSRPQWIHLGQGYNLDFLKE